MKRGKIGELTIRVKVGFVGTCEKYYTDNTRFPMIRTTNLKETGIDMSDLKYVTEDFYEKNKKSQLHDGDVLIARFGTSGMACVYHGGNAQCLNAIIVEPDLNTTIPEYLAIVINSRGVREQVNRRLVGSTQAILNTKVLSEIEIELPSLQEQKIVVECFNTIRRIRSYYSRKKELLDDLIKARFVEMFGRPALNDKRWKECSLAEVCNKITDGEHKNPEFVEEGVPMVMANNVQEYGVNFVGCRCISEEDYKRFSKKCKPEKGDVLLVSRGATIGRCCENNKDEEFALMGSVILMKRKEIITSCYLVNWLKNDDIRPLIYTTSAASAQQAIYMKDLSTKKILLPPMDLQNQFSEFVKQVDKSKFIKYIR